MVDHGKEPANVTEEAIKRAQALRRMETPVFATDILVKTSNPDALQKILREALHGVKGVDLTTLLGLGTPEGATVVDGCYVVRVVGDVDQVERVMTAHGYAEVFGRRNAARREEIVEAEGASGNLIDEDLMGDAGPQPLMGIPKVRDVEEDW